MIGINSQIASESGGNDGIGFAVPIDTIRPVADSIIADGTRRARLARRDRPPVTPAIAAALGAGRRARRRGRGADDRGPAADAGLRAATTAPDADVPRGGDIIVAVDGRAVEDMADVSRAVSSRAVGEPLARDRRCATARAAPSASRWPTGRRRRGRIPPRPSGS